MSGGILLVDDDPDALIVLKIILEGEGYTVYTVNNLDQVKAIVIEHKICLTIIDFILPGCHGKQVARALKEIDEKLQIIFLSGHEDVFEAVNDFEFDVYSVHKTRRHR
jgi:DNA-binding NtrC family response regulator